MPKIPEIERAEELTVLSITDPLNPELKKFSLRQSQWRPGPWNFFLRTSRQQAGLTLTQLDEAAALNPQTTHQYEAMRAWPTTKRVESITRVLGTSKQEVFPDWLSVYVRSRARPEPLEIPESRIGTDRFRLAVETSGVSLGLTDSVEPLDLLIARETHFENLQEFGKLSLRFRNVLVLTLEGCDPTEISHVLNLKPFRIREIQSELLYHLLKIRAQKSHL